MIGLDPFGLSDRFQLANNLFEPDRVKAEVLAARSDCLRDIFRLGGRHHEDDVPGRLLQRLQQGIEGRIGDLVGLVENPDLVTIASRTIARRIAQFANLINSAIRGRIDLDDVDRIARPNLGARLANSAGLRHRMIFRAAVQRHRQNSGDRSFAYAAVAAEDVPVRNPLLLNGIFQRASDVVLPNHIGELLWTVFSGKDLIAHRDYLIINGGRIVLLRKWRSFRISQLDASQYCWIEEEFLCSVFCMDDDALASYRQASGLIPVCAKCGRFRRNDGSDIWEVGPQLSPRDLEQCTHGMCPNCQALLFPGLKSSMRP